jgi:hypothetical protein
MCLHCLQKRRGSFWCHGRTDPATLNQCMQSRQIISTTEDASTARHRDQWRALMHGLEQGIKSRIWEFAGKETEKHEQLYKTYNRYPIC